MPKKQKATTRKSRVVYVSFDPDLAQRLIEDADLDDRSISNQIVRIVKKHYSGTVKVTA